MKKILVLFFFSCILSFSLYSAEKYNLVIDTVQFEMLFQYMHKYEADYPQIKSGLDPAVMKKINKQLDKSWSEADSLKIIQGYFEEHAVNSMEDYMESIDRVYGMSEEYKSYYFIEEGQHVKVESVIGGLLNVSGNESFYQNVGHYFFYSDSYDLRTGEKLVLNFEDFFSIEANELIELLVKRDEASWGDATFIEHIHYLYNIDNESRENRCSIFYFTRYNDELYINLFFSCPKPWYEPCQIPLKVLEEYIIHPDLKAALLP